jgi:quaternary ammonium compound-resistance protein SugE
VNWVVLIVAGFVEMLMALSLKESHGFSRMTPSILFVVFAVLSFAMLSYSLKTLPVGTAYAVWTGIGAAGTAVLGIVFLDEPRDAARLVSIVLIIAGVVGLRLASGGAA